MSYRDLRLAVLGLAELAAMLQGMHYADAGYRRSVARVRALERRLLGVLWARHGGVLGRASVGGDEYQEIPGRLGEVAIAWREGCDMRERLAERTFWRYRKRLLDYYGIDIGQRVDVRKGRSAGQVSGAGHG